jgi:hypothetical protein
MLGRRALNWVEEQEKAFKQFEKNLKFRTNEQIEYKAKRLLYKYDGKLIYQP